jgi:serine/threonine-protein kinase
LLYSNSVPSKELAVQSRAAAERALALAPTHPQALLANASYFRVIARDNERALEYLSRLQRLALPDAQTLAGIAITEGELGRFDSALRHLRQAERLDPRSPTVAANLGRVLTRLRRYEAADSVLVRALALSPGNRSIVQTRMLVWVGKGDLDGARRVIREAEAEIPPKDLAIYTATYNEMYWTLTPDQQALVLEGRPADFDGDVGSWAFAFAQIYAGRGDRERARAYADSARAGFGAQVAEAPNDGQLVALHALSLAYLGRMAEAIRQGERGTMLVPVQLQAGIGSYVQQLLARIYLMAGEHDKAIDRIEALLAQPGLLSVGWLRIDPAFDPLRDHPRFKKLVEERD